MMCFMTPESMMAPYDECSKPKKDAKKTYFQDGSSMMSSTYSPVL